MAARPNLDEENFKRLLYPVARGFFITINREEITVYRKNKRIAILHLMY